MTTEPIERALREDLFPGNRDALSRLKRFAELGDLTAFTGAGVSAPNFPVWTTFLSGCLEDALSQGFVSPSELEDYRKLIGSDPLEFAELLEQIYTRPIFRARLGDFFRNAESNSTMRHMLISNLGLRGIVTLNYDSGHEVAFAATGIYPNSGKAQDPNTLARWAQNDIFADKRTPILHLHGEPSDPETMVLTSSDYHKFYRNGHLATSFISNLWRSHRLLIVGFGFSDPFLVRVAEETLRTLPSDIRHFAFIGREEGSAVSTLDRKVFASKYRVNPIFYEIESGSNHSNLLKLLESLTYSKDSSSQATTDFKSIPSTVAVTQTGNASDTLISQLHSELFVGPGRQTLYTEPRFGRIETDIIKDTGDGSEYTINDILSMQGSLIISCRPEYGSTTIAKRLNVEFEKLGKHAMIADASVLPNYKRKLDEVFIGKGFLSGKSSGVLILDNFEVALNERLLKEIIGLKSFDRLIILMKQNMFYTTEAFPIDQYGMQFEWLSVLTMNRADIRTLTQQFYDTNDQDSVSYAVDKVYGDLVSLCIPITPSNVVMYLKIILKDGDFQPLNRVQIVQRYLTDLLSGPSDIYRDSFNSSDKLDVISAFVYHAHVSSKDTFSETEWLLFCKNHMATELVQFDERHLIATLKATRVLVSVGSQLYFKYRAFHTFFLGRYVAYRPGLLARFTSDSSYLRHSGLVEVISELSTDNGPLITDIVEKIDQVLLEFDAKFIPSEFDPFSELEWPNSADEDEKLWKPLNARLTSGPRNANEIDEIKRSLIGEQQANDQNVIVQDFDRMERRFVVLQSALVEAMHNNASLTGELKKRATSTIFKTYFRLMQVGLLLAPAIAKRLYFRWHGIVFINMEHSTFLPENERKNTTTIMLAVIPSVARRAAEQVGSRKLGEVYKLFTSQGDLSGYARVLNFACLLRAKPKGWMNAASQVIADTGRNKFYLYSMMCLANDQFHDEVNTHSERDELKRVLAMIQIKRKLNKDRPGDKDIGQVVKRMEKANAFDKKTLPAGDLE